MGEASSPYEVLQIQREGKLVSIVIIYDTGSEVTLCNDETGTMITNTKAERMRITISTINSEQTIPVKNCKLSPRSKGTTSDYLTQASQVNSEMQYHMSNSNKLLKK